MIQLFYIVKVTELIFFQQHATSKSADHKNLKGKQLNKGTPGLMQQAESVGNFQHKFVRRCKRKMKTMSDEEWKEMKEAQKKAYQGSAKRDSIQYDDLEF